jgi:transcriptional regulator with XRE-family HTH domain
MLTRLQELEREQGVTKAEISRLLGVPSTQVQAWFAAPTNLTLRSVGRLAAALDGRLVCRLEPVTFAPSAEPPAGEHADP